MNLDIAASLGRSTLHRIQILGRSGIFFFVSFTQAFVPPYRISRVIKEIEFIGSKSFLIVFVTALFTGMVLGLQGYHTLSKFGAEALLGSAVSLSIIRELGPVLCALMVTGRAGSAIAAEIGIMKITDQVPALEMMAIDPIQFIISLFQIPAVFTKLIEKIITKQIPKRMVTGGCQFESPLYFQGIGTSTIDRRVLKRWQKGKTQLSLLN